MRTSLTAVAVLIPLILVLAEHGHPAQTVDQPSSKQQASLRAFLRDYLGKPYPPFEHEEPTRYSAAWINLTDDKAPDAIVYLTGRGWCGTGGCNAFILAPKGSSYRVVDRITIAWPPIRVLTTKSHGWHDIGIWMEGGGIQPGYQAWLSFDGKAYRARDKATLQPSKHLQERVLPGIVAIPTTALKTGRPLYP